jgi:hypothetical protein
MERITADRRVECSTYGTSLPTFVCVRGFFHADATIPGEADQTLGVERARCGAT